MEFYIKHFLLFTLSFKHIQISNTQICGYEPNIAGVGEKYIAHPDTPCTICKCKSDGVGECKIYGCDKLDCIKNNHSWEYPCCQFAHCVSMF